MRSVNSTVNSRVAVTTVTAVASVKTQPDVDVKNESTLSVVQDLVNKQNIETVTDKQQPSEAEMKNITEKLNKFMQSMNTDINFVLHTETNTLMVRVEDRKTHQVLKECPAHELLDTVAKIRDCIGAFVDKKA